MVLNHFFIPFSWFRCSLLTFFAFPIFVPIILACDEICLHHQIIYIQELQPETIECIGIVECTWCKENVKLKFILKMLWQLQVINYPQTWSSNSWRWHRQIHRINRTNIKKAELFHFMVSILYQTLNAHTNTHTHSNHVP